ncbi:MAG: hypothetical protein KAX46_06435 [Chromatiaceae bacterium]|nr:hypothetical protein [Chromatiaceae bacterium]
MFADLIVPTAVVAQTLRISDAARAEGQTGTSPLTFTLTLSPKSGGPVTVRYATANGTAQAGTDYTAASGQVTFAPGQTSKTLPVKTREIVYLLFKQLWAPLLPILQGLNGREMP